MKTIPINQDTTIDWYKDYRVRAVNLETKEFDKVNEFCGDDNIVIHIDEDYLANPFTEEWDTTAIREKLQEDDMFPNSDIIIFVLYSPEDLRLVGYVEQLDTFGL